MGVVVMNEIPNRANMVFQAFREGEGSPDQAGHALTQCVVEAFDVAGLAAVLPGWPVSGGGEDGPVGLPEIGVADRAPLVGLGQGIPQGLRTRRAPVPHMDADDFVGFPV